MKTKKAIERVFFPMLLFVSLVSSSISCGFLTLQTKTEAPEEKISAENIVIENTYRSELITILYPLYGSYLDDFAIYTITNENQTPVTLVISSEISGYTDAAIDTVTIKAGETVEIRQNPPLQPDILDELNTARPASFHFTIKYLDNGVEKLVKEETAQTTVFARRDFPWGIEGFNSQEIFELTAAMITPNDPAVEELIRIAADYTSEGIMLSGYGDEELDGNGSVYERLKAIWEAEDNNYQLTYIDTSVTYAPGEIQRIRLPYEVLEQHSGNCIELAVLFSSAAEALELEVAMIRIPGHAYMAVRMDQVNAQYYVIETTLIGRADFDRALSRGGEELAEAMPHIGAADQWWDWITISEAREKGILPLPTQ